MSFLNSNNKNNYNLWSSFYDQYPNPTIAIDDGSFPAVYAHLENQKILEIGCGTGRHTARLLAQNNEVTGIDISSGMLARLKDKIASSRLNLIEGDFLTATMPTLEYQAIICSLTLEHIPNLDAFFQKAYRLLKNSGELHISELHPVRTSSGVFAHFKCENGSEVKLESIPHREVDIFASATQNGFLVEQISSVYGTENLIHIKQEWRRYLNQPMIQIWSMRRK